jgi:hypothetical protein
MRPLLAFCLLSALLPQQQCGNLASPEAIKGKVEEAMREDFPNARARIFPRQGAILALTCTQGVSMPFVIQIRDFIAKDQELNQKLGMIRLAPLVGGAHYQNLMLAFDGGVIVYDLDARTLAVVPPRPEMLDAYRKDCGFDVTQ